MRRGRRPFRNVREAVLCARIAGAVPLIWAAVHALALPRALAWLTPRLTSRRPLATERVLQLADRILDRRPWGIRPTCLLRSLVLYRFLRENGAPARIHFGVTSEETTLTGHAWLTLHDQPLLENSDPSLRFTVVLSYPAE